MKTLRMILGDQLNHEHSWFKAQSDEVTYVMMELGQELTYAPHHVQKVVAFFSAMRSFSRSLKSAGHRVIYLTLDDTKNQQDLKDNILTLVKEQGFERFEYQLPDEWRLDQQMVALCGALNIETKSIDTEHFLTSRSELQEYFKGKKQLLMESFYRMMRKKHNVLMDQSEPVGGQWNYDHENRKKMPKGVSIPSPKDFSKEVTEIVELIDQAGYKTIGTIDPKAFAWPTTRKESLALLDFFIEECLVDFGKYQDALTSRGWSLFHSRLSFALNTKLLHPMEVIQRVEACYRKSPDTYPLASIEGFVRQVLGWREYMRGIYWMHMPEYQDNNYFKHQRKLPEWFWTGQTKMSCLSHAIGQSLDHAYAHHIQRLMVTGNFALLAGVHPDEVDAWYLGIYIDAIEWVEITNTRGMSQFADGGIVATKPYISSANYIHKMGDHCKGCHYDHKQRTGDRACPFNSLYWNFIDGHRDKLGNNPRMGMIYRVWDKISSEDQAVLINQADQYLNKIEEL